MTKFSSLEFGTPEYSKQCNIRVLKSRCESFMHPEKYEHHKGWIKASDNLYTAKYNVVALDDGENYYVDSQLERVIEGKNVNYKLSFSDMAEILEDPSYKPLRKLGSLVFSK